METIKKHGLTFIVDYVGDTDAGLPWDDCDEHGPVREASITDKRPGEKVLGGGRGYAYLYDWQAACAMARRDGWNAEPYTALGRVERAVLADFDFLQGWCRGAWGYARPSRRAQHAPACEKCPPCCW